MKLYGLTISHRHGDNHYASLTPEDRTNDLYGFVAEWWEEVVEEVGELIGYSKLDAIETYFETQDDESYDEYEFDLELPGAEEMRAALSACAEAAIGDSNDTEIEALNEALDTALDRWPEIDRNAIVDAAWEVQSAKEAEEN